MVNILIEYGLAIFAILFFCLYKLNFIKVKTAIILLLIFVYMQIAHEIYTYSSKGNEIFSFIYTPQFLISMCMIILSSVRSFLYSKKHLIFLVYISLMYTIFLNIYETQYFMVISIGVLLLLIINYFIVENEIFIEYEKNIKNILIPELIKIFIFVIMFLIICFYNIKSFDLFVKIDDFKIDYNEKFSTVISFVLIIFSTIFTFLLPYGALKKQIVGYSKVCLIYKFGLYILLLFFTIYGLLFKIISTAQIDIEKLIYFIGFGTMIYGSLCLLFVNNIKLIVRYAGGSYIGLLFVLFGVDNLLEQNELYELIIFYLLSFTIFIYYFMTFDVNGVEITSINSFSMIGYVNFYYSLLIVLVVGMFFGVLPFETMFIKFKIMESLSVVGYSEYAIVFYISFCIFLYAMLRIIYKIYSINTNSTISYKFTSKVSENTAKVRFFSIASIIILMIILHA